LPPHFLAADLIELDRMLQADGTLPLVCIRYTEAKTMHKWEKFVHVRGDLSCDHHSRKIDETTAIDQSYTIVSILVPVRQQYSGKII
jgi:hypothetical protein